MPKRAKAVGKKKVTTFPKIKIIHIGPQGTMQRPKSPSRGCNAIKEALHRVNRRYKVYLHDSRAEAVRQAEVVIAIGAVKRSFGKPTLILSGELSPARYSDKIRRFLRETGATSVAFALTSNQSYWGIHKTIYYAFNWHRPNYSAFSEEDKQEVRQLYEQDGWTQPELAAKYGVSQPAITYVITGYPDHARFGDLRKKGYVTISSLALDTGAYFYEAVAKAEQMKITLKRVGPMFTMIDRKEARRLKAALRRRVATRNRRLIERKAQGLKGYSTRPDKDIPGWGTLQKRLSLSGNRKNKGKKTG